LRANQTQRLVQLIVVALSFTVLTIAQNNRNSGTKIEPLPRDLEIQLALSALPPHLRDEATVYVLNPEKGFEVARQGTNGFHAFIARIGDDTFRGTWPLTRYRDDILYPISFDDAGAKAQMRVFFDAAEMEAKGTPPEKLKKIIQERYKTHYYKAPERAGVSYMLAPILRTYVSSDQNEEVETANIPHIMHYAPNVSNEDIGGAIPTPEHMHSFVTHGHWPDTSYQYPFVIFQGPHGYLVQFLGVTERLAIDKEDEEMLARLCRLKQEWCLPH